MVMAEPPFGTPDSGLAQIVDRDGKARGMGFLLSPVDVVTCAHVVNVALGRHSLERTEPPADARLVVGFPLAEDRAGPVEAQIVPTVEARIARFRPPGRLPQDDIALLRLDEPAPAEVGVTVLADIQRIPLDGDELDIFGPPAGTTLPIHCDARFAGKVNQAWTQIDAVSGSASFVSGGFSGGRVWSHRHNAAVGMIVAKHDGEAFRRAFMIPASALMRCLSGIPGETRQLTSGFAPAWTVFSTLFLLLVGTHFLGERSGNYPHSLALGNGNSIVNGFFGMHLNAVLMPIALLLQLRFSRGFSEHPWWTRLPRYGSFARVPRQTTGRTTCVLAILLFVLAPLYVQGHFISRFMKEGSIYINPAEFGFTAQELMEHGQFCDVRSVHYCTHPCAGRFSLVQPQRGAKGGYLDNSYQFGNRQGASANAITFFPIAQPLAIFTLYGLSIAMAGVLLLRVLRQPSRERPGGCPETGRV